MHEKEKRYMEEHGPGPSSCRDEDSKTKPCIDPTPPRKPPKGMSPCKYDEPRPPKHPKPECMRGVSHKLPPCQPHRCHIQPKPPGLPIRKCCVPEPPEPPSLTFCQEKKIKEIEARGKPVCPLPVWEPPPPPPEYLAICIERLKNPYTCPLRPGEACKVHQEVTGNKICEKVAKEMKRQAEAKSCK